MKKSHSFFQTRKAHSMTNKMKSTKIQSNSIKESEIHIPIKTESIFNFYNNNNNINSDLEMDESTLGDIEYTKTLQLALRDAINQNEKLTEELNKYIQENKDLKDEIDEKDNVIYELSQYYQFCQTNHLNNNCINNSEFTDDNEEYNIPSKKKRNFRNGRIKNRKKYNTKSV